MENNFNDMQKIWQSKKASSFDLDALMHGLRLTEKKQRKERIAIAIIGPITFVFLIFVLPLQESNLVLITPFLIGLAMAWVAWLSFKSKLLSSEDSLSLSNRQYVETQLRKLQHRYRIAEKYMYFYGLLLIIAVNLAYFVFLAPLPENIRWAIHLGVSLMIILLIHFIIKSRLKNYDKTLKPLMQHLQQLLLEAKQA
ncbi:hypothetical protein D0X99_16330 [Algoriphagus lacus]|uniref:Uncharacterized protein n=1 Tax=Algoriphagus lacus TaxID=2056311 RepID=A0A418PNL5_9BACT|nr:hypothetical protein [Algoriphagus lacus]RIW13343.1 hypothetical protein D0X99_16330 [Algoriphagus lacus]